MTDFGLGDRGTADYEVNQMLRWHGLLNGRGAVISISQPKKVKRKRRRKPRIHTREGYAEYRKTNHWKAKRKQALYHWNHKCADCHSKLRLHVHHLNYYRLYGERMTDLVVLCCQCHKLRHPRK